MSVDGSVSYTYTCDAGHCEELTVAIVQDESGEWLSMCANHAWKATADIAAPPLIAAFRQRILDALVEYRIPPCRPDGAYGGHADGIRAAFGIVRDAQ